SHRASSAHGDIRGGCAGPLPALRHSLSWRAMASRGLRSGGFLMPLHRHTLFITGASRGIGLAIALRAARDGANIVIAAKTAEPHPKLPGTIFTAAEAIAKAGGTALPLPVDVRDEEQVKDAIAQTVATF